MSLTVKAILLASAIVAIIFASVVFVYTKRKIKKTKAKYRTEEATKYDAVRKKDAVAERGDTIGELLWDLKDETKNPLDDVMLEYIINTGIRNGYKTFKTVPEDKYVQESLIKLGKLKKDILSLVFHLNSLWSITRIKGNIHWNICKILIVWHMNFITSIKFISRRKISKTCSFHVWFYI